MMKKIAPDKRKHFFVGILMGAVLQTAAWFLLPDRPVLGVILVLIAIVAISYGFELLSLITGRGHHEVMDAIASIIGGITGMAINWGAILLLQRVGI